MVAPYSELEQKALEVFVTSATAPIYACKSEILPEVFGAFGSFFSRNPKDLRAHLLDAIRGTIQGHESDRSSGDQNLQRLADGEFHNPSEALAAGLTKSQEFFRKWYGNYSHKSIANTVWIPFVGTNVSQLFARHLAYDQLAFFIEQSTRFVKFDVSNLHLDADIMASQHREQYIATLQQAGVAYERFTELAADHYGKEIPFALWLSKQDHKVQSVSDKDQHIKYRNQLKAKAFDVARLLLPQAVRTNIAWILDARSTEFDIAAWKGSPLAEMRESAGLIEQAGGAIAPSLLKRTAENPYYADQYRSFGGDLHVELLPQQLIKGVDVLSWDPAALDKSVAYLLMRANRAGDFNRIFDYTSRLGFAEKIDILRRVTEKRGDRDEWVDMEEAFDCAKITLQIKTDIGAARDLRRHQKWDRNEGIYTLDNGYYLPAIIREMGSEAERTYRETIERTADAERIIRTDFPDAVQYIMPMAANHSMVMSAGLDQFQYFVATRTVPQGHFSYREDAYNMAQAVCEVHPWILGLTSYPRGKNIQEVYRNAPLKNILRMYLGDTGLHQ